MADGRDHKKDSPASAGQYQALREIVGIAGAVLAGVGAWMHYQPAGMMVAGGILVCLSVIGTLRNGGV